MTNSQFRLSALVAAAAALRHGALALKKGLERKGAKTQSRKVLDY
jgi:hypothetical protein